MTDQGEGAPRLYVLGAGGHAREIADVARDCTRAGLVDFRGFAISTESGDAEVDNAPVVTIRELGRLDPRARFVVGIGDASVRRRVLEEALRQGLVPISVCHPAARVSATARVSPHGVVLFPGCVISSGAVVGDHSHVHFNAVVAHDVVVGAHCLVGSTAVLGPRVNVADGTRVEAGVSLEQAANV